MRRGAQGRVALLLLAVLSVAACELDAVPTATSAVGGGTLLVDDAKAPAIAELSTSSLGSGLVALRVKATDPANAALSYAWAADGGDLLSRTGPQVQWRAPQAAGTFTVTVTVTNSKGLSRQATQKLTVSGDGQATAQSQPQISQAGTVSASSTGAPVFIAGSTTTATGGNGQFQVPTSVLGNGQLQVPSPVPSGSPLTTTVGGVFASPTPIPSPTNPFQPVATPVPGASVVPSPGSQPIATPTPTPPPASPVPSPAPTVRPPTPQPGVPVPPPSRWIAVSSPTGAGLNALHFIPGAANDFQEGWAVGDGPTVLHSTNSGMTWQGGFTSGIPSNSSLNHVFFASSTEGFVSTQLGKVYRTLDGGNSWQDISPTDFPLSLMALVGYNAQILVASSSDGRVIRSENANAATPATVSWTVMDSKPPARPNDQAGSIAAGAAFPTAADSSLTWFVGDKIYMLDSDGTPQWARKLDLGGDNARSVFLTSSNELWVGTGTGNLYKSTDGGNGWGKLANGSYFNREHNGNNTMMTIGGITDIDFLDTNNGFILAGTEVLDTKDGGTTWKRTAINGFISDLQIQDRVVSGNREFFGWAVGSSGMILRYAPN